MGLFLPKMLIAMTNSMMAHLREAGLSDSRIRYLLNDTNRTSQAEANDRDLALVMNCMSRAMNEVQPQFFQSMLVMPERCSVL